MVSTDFNAPNIFSEMLKFGKNDLFIRYSRVLEETKGQQDLDDSTLIVETPDN